MRVRRDPFLRGKPDNPETGTDGSHEVVAVGWGRQDEPRQGIIDAHLDAGYWPSGTDRPAEVEVDRALGGVLPAEMGVDGSFGNLTRE